MKKTLIIGSFTHEKADNVEWTQSYQDIENYDCIIIDLTSFPKNYPPTIFSNIGILKRTVKLLINENKEIFCIMEKPLKILFKRIPINYSWIPFPQKLVITPMLLGKTKILTNERFAEYMKNVKRWDNELYWSNTKNCTFDDIAINKSGKTIAATISIGERGKIHLLPKPSKTKHKETIKLLVDLAKKKGPKEYSWLKSVKIPKIAQVLHKNTQFDSNISAYRNLFSIDHQKIIQSVQLVLENLGIKTKQNLETDLTDIEDELDIKVISVNGKVKTQHTIFKQLMHSVENPSSNKKIVLIANTYRKLPPDDRMDKEHLDHVMKILFETSSALFLSTLSIFHLWKKVISGQISIQEASWIIQNKTGEIQV